MTPSSSLRIPPQEQVFCSRSINMDSIKSIGFDMDYTLVLYKPYAFEEMLYVETLHKLVAHGYPSTILSWKFDPRYMIRGLVIDKRRGNILKLDRHRYVKIAYHGFQKLSSEERKKIYDGRVLSYQEPEFSFLDTFFSLSEAFLVSKLIEYKDHSNELKDKSYFDFANDVRKYLDMSHRDDNVKNIVAKNPEKYVLLDPHLPEILTTLKKTGKKLFILTNSLWNYVDSIMGYLLPPSTNHANWTDYFDFVITGAQKPQFFSSKNLMYEVDPSNGFLKNLLNIPLSAAPDVHSSALPENSTVKIFQGGHVQQFQEMLSVSHGSEVLYVGDHIYGDVLRSKKAVVWRTLLLIDELEDDMKHNFHPIWGALMKTGRHNSFFSEQVCQYACLYTTKFTNLRHYSAHKKFEAMPDVLPHDNVV